MAPKAEMEAMIRQFDAIDLFQFLDAALHLFGFGRLVTEAIDEYFQLLDAFPLIAIRRFELLHALGFRGQRIFVVAGIKMDALVPYLSNLVNGDVEKIAVVRDQHKSVRIMRQILFQPVAGFEIEMVGGLVQEQQVWFLQQQLGQGDAHLPASGEFFCSAMPIFLAESEAHEHASDLGLNGVPFLSIIS